MVCINDREHRHGSPVINRKPLYEPKTMTKLDPIVIPGTPDLPARDPNCDMCSHMYFPQHLHTDGSARAVSRTDNRSVYIQQVVAGVITCTCANGEHSQGKRPKCWHSDGYEHLLREREQLGRVIARPGHKLQLEDIFPD